MRKFTKGLLIVSIFLFIIGAGCLIAGFVMGISTGDLKRAAEKYIPFLAFQEQSITIDEDVITLPDLDGEKVGAGSYTFEKDAVTQLELDVATADCVIYPNDTDQVVVNITNGDNVKVNLKNGTLEIEKEGKVLINNDTRLEIFLPTDLYLTELDLQAGAGNISIESPIQAKKISMEIGASNVNVIGKMTADSISVEAGAGRAAFDYLDAGRIQVENGAGKTILGLAGQKEEYNVTIESAIGSVLYGDERFAGITDTYRNQPKDADRILQIESAVGKVEITFKEEI